MNLASNTAPVALDHAVEGGRHPSLDRMKHLALHLGDDLAGIALVPVPVEVLGHGAELDDQVVRQVLRLDLAALFPPQPEQGGFIVAHDDPGVRAADERCACLAEFSYPLQWRAHGQSPAEPVPL